MWLFGVDVEHLGPSCMKRLLWSSSCNPHQFKTIISGDCATPGDLSEGPREVLNQIKLRNHFWTLASQKLSKVPTKPCLLLHAAAFQGDMCYAAVDSWQACSSSQGWLQLFWFPKTFPEDPVSFTSQNFSIPLEPHFLFFSQSFIPDWWDGSVCVLVTFLVAEIKGSMKAV